MREILEVISTLFPVFFIIGLGYVLNRINFLSHEGLENIRKIVFYISLPVLLFTSASNSSLSETFNPVVLGAVFVISLVMAVVIYLSAAKASPSRRGVIVQGTFRTNMVFVGLPIIAYAYGDAGLAAVVVLIAFLVPFFNFLAVIALSVPHYREPLGTTAVRKVIADIVMNPLVIGCSIGLIFSALGITLPSAVNRSCDLIGRLALPLALIMVGASLEFSQLKGEMKISLAVSLLKLIIYPGMILLALVAFDQKGIALKATVLMMAAPVSPSSYIMAVEMKGDGRLASALLVATTMFSMITSVIWLTFFRWLPF
ncbi:MAG: AEC family transporter [Deltaproteobacteria bacterium]|nr:AEC family transporter [Deltaproteobacteria bacterium]